MARSNFRIVTGAAADARSAAPGGRGNGVRIRQELEALASSWRNVLTNQPGHARPIVSALLVDRVTFTPTGTKRWTVSGAGTIAGLFERVFIPRDGVPNGN
jgi:hypothetical protein